jgi:hypothetical protein
MPATNPVVASLSAGPVMKPSDGAGVVTKIFQNIDFLESEREGLTDAMELCLLEIQIYFTICSPTPVAGDLGGRHVQS